jgi:hypothetical protein
MQLPEFTHSTTLRWTFLAAGIVVAFIGALLGFIYLQTKADLTIRSDRMIASQIGVFGNSPGWVDILRSYEKRREFAKLTGSWVKASIMFQPCFLAVERNDRMVAKSIAPSGDRKPPDIFCRSFIMRTSRSA